MRDGRALSTRQGRQEAAVGVFLTAWCPSGMSSWGSQLGWGHFGVLTVGIAQGGAQGVLRHVGRGVEEHLHMYLGN